MDRQAIISDTVNLFDEVGQEYQRKFSKEPTPSVHIALFERAHTFIIHKNISAEKGRTLTAIKETGGAENCTKCGRKFTEKELKFLADQPDKPRICYHCTKGL